MSQPQATSPVSNGRIRAIVGKVRGAGHKRFVVTYLERQSAHPDIKPGESITFSLAAWQGETEPRKEQVVELHGVQLFAKGWRATSARPITI